MNKAAEFRSETLQQFPGASVLARGKNWIRHTTGNPNQFDIRSSIAALHYGIGEDQEIDTAWTPTTGAWQWEMLTNGHQLFARNVFNAGNIFRFEKGLDWVQFDPQSINWIDENTSRQQIAIKQPVNAVASDNILDFPQAYGAGRHFRYESHAEQIKKLITIDSAGNLPAPTLQGQQIWFEAEFSLSTSSAVELYLDGQKWQKTNGVRVQTANRIEFRDAATGAITLWWLDFARAYDSSDGGNETFGQMEVRRQGGPTALFITVRIPKTWIDAAVFPIFIDPTIDASIGASEYDGYEVQDDTGMNYVSTAIRSAANTVISSRHIAAFIFQGYGAIAQGDTVDVCDITIQAFNTANDDANVDIHFERSVSAVDLATENDIINRTRTTASVAWVVDGLGTSDVASPSLVTPLQEVVDNFEITGNVAVHFVGRSDVNKSLQIDSYDRSAGEAADLHVVYTAAGAPAGQPFRIRTQGVPTGAGRHDRPSRWN